MSLFSQRAGIKPAAKSMQREAIDQETRNALWSVLWPHYELCYKEEYGYGRSREQPYRKTFEALGTKYWTDLFKNALDTERSYSDTIHSCREYFFSCQWHEVLDFIEFTTKQLPEGYGARVAQELNLVLEKENCVYRFVGNIITEITSEAEIAAIDSAIEGSTREVAEHLKKALQFLSDRKKPDYHNSIKESVSAIEAAAREVSGEKGATLSDAVKVLNKKHALHPALTKMLLDLYGYAGDEGGVRHANKETGKPVSQAEARLIMILAAAACGFLTAKSA
ncbi:MAG: hypothetical protein PSV13_11665 [Lacunisphaera sp.]|nr:hypothetical protein [Lacunisphaera sp.]